MKNLKHLFFGLFIILLTLQSCKLEDESIVLETPETTQSVALRIALNSYKSFHNADSTGVNSDTLFGFSFNYPIQLGYNTETIIEIASPEGLLSLLNSETQNLYFTSIGMPFGVYLNDGTPQTISTEENFFTLLESCEDVILPSNDYFFQGDCFSFVFPIQLQTINNSIYTINSNEEFTSFIDEHFSDWYFEFIYPFNVITTNNITITLNSDYELFNLLTNCYDEGCNCYQDYNPVCVMVDATTIIEYYNTCEANCFGFTEADFIDCPCFNTDCSIENITINLGNCNTDNSYELTLNFDYENNIDNFFILYIDGYYSAYYLDELPLALSFPYNGQGEDSLEILMDGGGMCYAQTSWNTPDCGEVQSTFLDYIGSCYNFEYPIQVNVNGSTINIENDSDIFYYFENPSNQASLVFPLDIFDLDAEENNTLNNEEELSIFIAEHCED